MKYPRIPANIANHQPRLFGLEYNSLFILIPSVLGAISILEIYPYLSIIILVAASVLTLGRINGTAVYLQLLRSTRRLAYHSVRRIAYNYSSFDMGEFKGIRIGSKFIVFAELEGIPILEMRTSEQSFLLLRIRELIRDTHLRIDFHTYMKNSPGNLENERILISMWSKGNKSNEDSEGNILSDAAKLKEGLVRLGFRWTNVNFADLKTDLGNIMGIDVKSPKENIDAVFGRMFIKKPCNALILNLVDSSSEASPFALSFLEGSGVMSVVHFSFERIADDESLKILSASRAQRRAEVELNGERMGKSHLGISAEIQTIQGMEERVKENQDPLMEVSMSISIIGNHPSDLPDLERRFVSAFSYLRMRLEREQPNIHSIAHLFPFISGKGYPYLMNASSCASLLPLFVRNTKDHGILIGVNDLNGKRVLLDIIEGRGNNFMVIGETGSGKSYFCRMIIKRLIDAGLISRLYIFDPLSEYQESNFPRNSGVDKIRIFRKQENSQFNDYVYGVMTELNELMMADVRWKVILVEESHMAIASDPARKILEGMVRHSRHYNTIIINVSQNVDDFLLSSNSSLALNSSHIFLFRTRKLNEPDLMPLKLDGFDGIRPANLAGGSGYNYSECYYSNGKYCKKLRIID